MKQAFMKAPDLVEIRETDLPVPGSDEVLIDVRACGICGSDLNAAAVQAEFAPFGHEFSGVVEAAGSAVRNVRAGDRVTVESSSFCGTCDMCRDGRPELCRNRYIFAPQYCGFAEKVIAKAGAAVPFEGISFEEAALTEPLGVALDLTETADIRLNDRVVIFGAGPIGLMAVRLARLKGAGRVTVLARSHSRARIALAERYGADRIILTDLENPVEALRGERTDRILVTTPPSTLPDAVSIASFGAVISHIGFGTPRFSGQCTLDIDRRHFKRLQLRLSFAAPALYFPRCLDMIKSGLIDVRPLITHRFPLEELGAALSACRTDREHMIKAMMVR